MKLSIVVPVYNVEAYLKKCVDSLLDQDLSPSDYEIILVDDGATDRSSVICDAYAAAHGNIRAIHQENAGLSAARNTGIAAATGQYIQFVDSDDYLEPNAIKPLLEQIEQQGLDLLRFNYENVNDKEEIIHPVKNPKMFSDYSNTVTDGLSFLTDRLSFACYAWQFILRTEIARQFLFMEGIHFEDTEWVSRMMPSIGRASSNDRIVYYYRLRENSITTGQSEEKLKKNIADKIQIISFLKQREGNVARKEWYEGMTSSLVLSVLGMVAESFYTERAHFLKELDSLRVYPLSGYHLTESAQKKRRLINFSPRLYCHIYHFNLFIKKKLL